LKYVFTKIDSLRKNYELLDRKRLDTQDYKSML